MCSLPPPPPIPSLIFPLQLWALLVLGELILVYIWTLLLSWIALCRTSTENAEPKMRGMAYGCGCVVG